MSPPPPRLPFLEEILERGLKQILGSLDLPTLEETEILGQRLELIERRLARLISGRSRNDGTPRA